MGTEAHPSGTGTSLPPTRSLEIHRALRLSIWDAVFSNLYGNLTGGVFLVGYMLALQASEIQIGLLAAFPLIANVVQLFSVYLIELVGRRRPLALVSGALARLIWLVLIGLSLWSFSSGQLLRLSLGVIALSQIGTAINNLAWLSWMADLVPEGVRGRYFSLRNSILGGAALLATLAGGHFLDQWKRRFPQGELDALCILFLVAVVCGVISLIIQARTYEPPFHEGKGRASFSRRMFLPVQDVNFRRFIIFLLVWIFGVYVSGPFFAVYMLKYLHFNYATVASYSVLSSVADLLSVQFWGRLSDRETNKPVLLFCSFFAALVPFGWLFTTAHPLIVIALLHIQGGLFWSGVHLCTANLILKITPPAYRSIYYSTFNMVEGVVAMIAPLAGGAILHSLPELGSGGRLNWNPFFVVFLLSAALRLAALPLLTKVSEPPERSTWEAIRVIRNVRAFTTTMGFNRLYHFWLRARRRG